MMRSMKKQTALLLAGLISAAAVTVPMPQPRAAQTASVLAFAESVLPMLHPTDADTFLTLRYAADEGQLYLDGRPAGTEAAGFRIENGTLLCDAAPTLAQAESLLGCEVYEADGDLCVTSPFQSAALLVKAEGAYDTYGAEAVSEAYDGLRVLQYATPAEAYRAYQALAANDAVQLAEPNRIVHIAEYEDAADAPAETASDNWGYQAVGASQFRTDYLQSDAHPVTVAVIDTGLYPEHNWFAGRIAAGGASFCEEDRGRYTDWNGHGTHCAGIIACQTSPNVKILPLKALDGSGYGTTLALYCAMMYALEQHADIVSLSLNGYGFSPLMEQAVTALTAAGIPCVAAAGNEADDTQYYAPANIPETITIASVGATFRQSSFSNFGDFVDFCAPGERIESAGIYAPDATAFKSGTSMATPMAAACFANLLQYDSSLTIDGMYEILRRNAKDLGDAGYDTTYGWGMVDLHAVTFSDIGCEMPQVSIAGGDYAEVLHLTLSCADADAEIYYTTDCSIPTAETAEQYNGEPIEIAKTTDFRAIAVSPRGTSRILHEQYRLTCDAPAASLPGGEYDGAVSVTLTVPAGAAVYYTTNGDVPTAAGGQRYGGEMLTIAETTVLRAAAYLGETASEVMTVGYVIGGQHPDRLFRVEDGCLTAYFGTLTELDLPAMLPDAGITAIGADVFAGTETLTRIVLPDTVTEIGENAFAGCTALTELECPWEQLTSVGARAFAESAVSGDIRLDALRSLGAYAFADTKYADAVSLSPQITALPEGVFQGSGIRRLSAPAVTEIGAYAMSNASALTELLLPFDRLTAVGAHAFESVSLTQAGVPEPVFAALETVGAYAFAYAECNTMTFPALKTAAPYVLKDCAAAVLNLPAAERLSHDAIGFAVSGRTCVVLGDALRDIAPDAVAAPYDAAAFAGAEQSPLRAFAGKNQVDYLVTPAVYLPAAEASLMQYESARIAACPLGENTALRVYAEDGTMLADSDTCGFVPPTDDCGSTQYTVCAVQDGEAVGAAQTVAVTVTAAAQTGTVAETDTPLMIQWDEAAPQRTAMYTFTAAQAGDYNIFAADGETAVGILREGGAMTAQRGSGAAPERLQSIPLEAGESVRILIRQESGAVPAFLTVTQTAPQNTVCDARLTLKQNALPRDDISLPEAELVWEDDRHTLHLTLGQDFVLTALSNADDFLGTAYACGIGSYSGLCTAELVLYDSLTAEQPLTVQELTADARYYRFVPERSGTYTFLTDFDESMLAAPEQDALTDAAVSLTLYDGSLRVLSDFEDTAYTMPAYGTCELKAGLPYYIAVSAMYGCIPAVQLAVVQEDAAHSMMLAEIAVAEEMLWQFAPCVPACTVTAADGTRLTEGEDYIKILLHHRVAGEMTVLLHGIGAYYGTAAVSVTVLPPDLSSPDAQIALDTPVSLPDGAGVYHFNIVQETELSLRAETDAPWEAVIYRWERREQLWMPYAAGLTAADAAVYLDAGDYALLICADAPCSFVLGTVQVCRYLSDAKIRVSPLMYTGMPLEPEFTVTANGTVLEEGKDYIILPYAPVLEAGEYSAELMGIGDFSGFAETSFFVRPNPDSDYPEAAVGENTVQIDTAGTVQMLRWIPRTAHACIVKTGGMGVSVAVYDENGHQAAALSGLDYQYAECSVRIGRTYYIAAAFEAEVYAGSFSFTLLEDYTLLEDCAAEAPALFPLAADDSVPAFALTDGTYRLQQDTDYVIRSCGEETAAGHAEIYLQGIGRYVGMLCYSYYQYPPYETLGEIPETVLSLDVPAEAERNHPAAMQLYRFTAETAGKYYLHVPTDEENSVCTVIYDSSGAVLPMDTRMLMLDAGETVSLLCITEWLETDWEAADTYEIKVSDAPPCVLYAENGYLYELEDGTASLIAIPAGMTGLHLPETVYDAENDILCELAWIAPECVNLMGACTVYGEAGGFAEMLCLEYGLCFAAEDALCTVRGDVTGDGICDMQDVLTLGRWLAECDGMTLSPSAADCADCDGDGILTEADLAEMLRMCAGIGG